MIESLSLPLLVLIFGLSAVLIWFAGIKLSETADILTTHFGLGEALGGLILLAIVTNLPEIAITVRRGITAQPGACHRKYSWRYCHTNCCSCFIGCIWVR